MPEHEAHIDRTLLVGVATELLMAAITFRDIAGSLPPAVLATCPPDIAQRLLRHGYQAAFDGLPADIRSAARAYVDADPSIRAARELHHA